MVLFWKIVKISWTFIMAFGGLVGVLYLAQDVEELPQALKKWRALVPIDRETAVIAFAFLLVFYIGWMDIRPYIYEWWDRRNPTEKQPLERFVRSRDAFTIKEAACLLASCEMTKGELAGPAIGFLSNLEKMVRQEELIPVNALDGNILVPRMPAERAASSLGIGRARRLYSNLEISKKDLRMLAVQYDAEIPGLD